MSGVTRRVKKALQDIGSGLGLVADTTSQERAVAAVEREAAGQRELQARAAVEQAAVATEQSRQINVQAKREVEQEGAEKARRSTRGRRGLLSFLDEGTLGLGGGLLGGGLSRLLGGGS